MNLNKHFLLSLLVFPLFAIVVTVHPAMGASAWEATFADDTLNKQVPEVATVVVPAGSPTSDRDEAAAAVRKRLSQKGGFLVMDAQAIGEIGALADKDIVARCAKLPVLQVIVTRVFDSGPSDSQIVATVYDKSGNIKTAFSAKRGERFALSGSPVEDATSGLSSEATSQIQKVLEDHGKDSMSEEAEIEKKKAQYFAEHLTYRSHKASKGEYGEAVDIDDFFKKVGRPELAKERETRSSNKTFATIALLGVAALGVVLAADAEECKDVTTTTQVPKLSFNGGPTTFEPRYSTENVCTDDSMKLNGGILMLTGGLVGAILVQTVSSSPVTNNEGRQLADGYNDKLRQRLGLKASDVELKVQLKISQQAAGIGLRIVF
jgi:hypothetical protein